ncbi:MAG TPA: acyl-CoA dehydrogenase family protein, partial [Ilumatobacteraceae bacterium]|nr:acyl-CoA dehydrogenase family protein [Ilumatobacteraceae bacterium]
MGPPDFRSELREFLDQALADASAHRDPTDLTGLAEDYERAMHRAAADRGWLGLRGQDLVAFNTEVARSDAPLIDTAMTLTGSVIAAYRPALLPLWQSGQVQACIAYTEADAGSDLATIASTAARDGDGWLLSGTKVLVTGAHKADWCVTVMCTDPASPVGQRMTMFLVAMDTPGVSVQRRETMNGWTLGDIHFGGVRVGGDAVLGEVGAGWRQMLSAVAAERSGAFWLGFAAHSLALLVDHVRPTKHVWRGAAP